MNYQVRHEQLDDWCASRRRFVDLHHARRAHRHGGQDRHLRQPRRCSGPIINADSFVEPVQERMIENAVAFLGDVNVTLLWRVSQNWTFKAGYMLLWADQVALASDNFNAGPPFVAGPTHAVHRQQQRRVLSRCYGRPRIHVVSAAANLTDKSRRASSTCQVATPVLRVAMAVHPSIRRACMHGNRSAVSHDDGLDAYASGRTRRTSSSSLSTIADRAGSEPTSSRRTD